MMATNGKGGSNGIRAHQRVPLNMVNATRTERLGDISLGGMLVQSATALRIGDNFGATLPSPLGLVKLQGRIVRARCTGLEEFPFEYGLQFTNLDDESRDRVKAFIDEQVRDMEAADIESGEQIGALLDRISELQREVDIARSTAARMAAEAAFRDEQSGGDRAPGTPPQHPPAHPLSDVAQDLATSFDPRRFARLVALGQPLMPLVEEPSAHVEGETLSTVSSAFSASFNLTTLEAKLGTTLTKGDIMQSLFTFYEKGLIDFA
jgi:hypothetical protein